MLGVSVVANPISPTISDISLRANEEPSEGQSSGQHSQDTTVNQDGDTHPEKRLDGVWHTLSYKNTVKPVTIYMKIRNGVMVGIWPPRKLLSTVKRLFENEQWNRERDLSLVRIVSDFPLFENLTSYVSLDVT